jgi:archaellum component FlaC
MEVALIFFITVVGLGNEINKSNDRINELETQYEMIDLLFMRLAGSHAAFYAGQKLINEDTNAAIEDLYQKIEEEQY